MLKEILVGLAFAFALGALFAAVSIAGVVPRHADRLLVRRRSIDPVTGNQSASSSQLYALFGLASSSRSAATAG